MTIPFSVIIEYEAGDKTKSIFDSLSIDEKY